MEKKLNKSNEMKVLIKKMNTLEDAKYPDAFIPSDYSSTKDINPNMFKKPTVGESFRLPSLSGGFISSTVVEIIENTGISGVFKTLNSVYYWELLTSKNLEKDETKRKN